MQRRWNTPPVGRLWSCRLRLTSKSVNAYGIFITIMNLALESLGGALQFVEKHRNTTVGFTATRGKIVESVSLLVSFPNSSVQCTIATADTPGASGF